MPVPNFAEHARSLLSVRPGTRLLRRQFTEFFAIEPFVCEAVWNRITLKFGLVARTYPLLWPLCF